MSSHTEHDRVTRTEPSATRGPRGQRPSGRGFVIGSMILSVAAVFFLPIILGPVAFGLAYWGHRKGDPWAKKAMVGAVVATVIGLILGFVAFTAMNGA